MNFKVKIFSFLIYFFFFLCLLPVAVFFYKHPAYNWDMLGYMAVIVRMDGVKDINDIHRITYESAKKDVPPGDYRKLVENPPHRVRFANDPSYFKEILPIHVVKPLYVWSAYLFYKIGFSLPLATVIPSIIAYILIGLLLFHWLKRYFKTAIAFLAALFIMTSMFMEAYSKASSPDNLSAFFLFAAFYFILEKPSTWLIFLFLLLSVFTRADNVITCFFLLSFLTFSGKWKGTVTTKNYFLMLAIIAVSYLLIILPVRQFGWSLFYYAEYARHMDFNRDFDKPLSLSDYFSYMYSKAVTGFVNSNFTFFMFLMLLVVFPLRMRRLTFDQVLALLFALIILIRFFLLPDLSDRFYISFYLVILILLVRKLNVSTPMKI
jgi:hypothetical protein